MAAIEKTRYILNIYEEHQITFPSPPPLSSSIAVPVLLAVLRVLLNLTHDNELGSHRLGEQDGAVKTVLDIVFMVRGRE